jgi:hypothetical protein
MAKYFNVVGVFSIGISNVDESTKTGSDVNPEITALPFSNSLMMPALSSL